MLVPDEEPDEEPEVEVATGTTTVAEPMIWVETACVAVCCDAEEPDAVAEAPEPGLASATTKGFEELPPAAFVRSKVVRLLMSCCWILAEGSAELIALPRFTAHIQALLLSVGLIEPPLH